jgi:predicted MFS family arabinose efflux permease
LHPRIGFGWATRSIAFIALATLSITNLVMRQRTLPATRRKLFNVSALREAPFMLCTAGLFFGFMALYIPFFYIGPFAHSKASAGATLAFYFVPILNASSVFGCVFPNALADRIGTLNMLIPCTFACGIVALSWIAVDDTGDLIVFAILYGFFSGSFVSLPPTTIVSLSDDLHKVGTRLGMSFSISGFGILVGTPVAGTLLNIDTGNFLHAQIFCAASMMVSCVCLGLARVAKTGAVVMIKA